MTRARRANRIIQDIDLGKDADGKVRYVATFVLTKPVDMTKASGLLWHEVPNRGNPRPNVVQERAFGDIDLTSAWQGDNAGATYRAGHGGSGAAALAEAAGGEKMPTAHP